MVDEQWLINNINSPIDDPSYSELLNYATQFAFKMGKYRVITIERRIINRDGTVRWVVANSGMVWNRVIKDFEWDTQPSNRSEAFYNRTTFTLIEAFQIVQYIRDRAIRHRKATAKELEEFRYNKTLSSEDENII